MHTRVRGMQICSRVHARKHACLRARQRLPMRARSHRAVHGHRKASTFVRGSATCTTLPSCTKTTSFSPSFAGRLRTVTTTRSLAAVAGRAAGGPCDCVRERMPPPPAAVGRALFGRAAAAPRRAWAASPLDMDGGVSSIDTRRCGGVPRGDETRPEERSRFARPTAAPAPTEARRAVAALVAARGLPAPSFSVALEPQGTDTCAGVADSSGGAGESSPKSRGAGTRRAGAVAGRAAPVSPSSRSTIGIAS